jgi:hypothetical protein
MKGALFLMLPPLLERHFLSHSLDLTGLNWGQLEIQKRYRIDRQKVGVRGVVHLAGETQPLLFLFFYLDFFKALLLTVL